MTINLIPQAPERIDEREGRKLFDAYPTAPPQEQEQMRPRLEAFRDQMRNDERRQKADHVQRMFTDPDYFEKSFQDSGVKSMLETTPLPGQAKVRAANMAMLATKTGKSASDILPIYDQVRDGWAKEFYKADGPVTEEQFFNLAKADFERDGLRTEAMGQLVSAMTRTTIDSMVGADAKQGVEVFADWWKQHGENFDPEEDSEIFEKLVMAEHNFRQEVAPFADVIRRVYNTLAAQGGVQSATEWAIDGIAPEDPQAATMTEGITQIMADMSTRERQLVYAAVSAYAEGEGRQPTDFWDSIGSAVGKIVPSLWNPEKRTQLQDQAMKNLRYLRGEDDSLILQEGGNVSSLRDLQGMPYQIPGKPVTPEQREELIKQNEQTLKELQVARELEGLKNGTVAPIDVHATGLLGRVEKGVYDIIPSLGYTAMAGIPFVGVPLVTRALYASEYDQLLSAYPDADPQVLQTTAAITALPKALIERFQFRLLTGRLPVFGKVLEKMAGRGVGVAKRVAAGYLGQMLEQNVQEALQDSIDVIGEQITLALNEDMPSPHWEAAWREFGEQRVDTFFALLPLVTIGAGALTYREVKRGEAYTRDIQTLREVGFDAATAKEISNIPDADARDAAIVQKWETRSPVSIAEGVNLATARLEAEQLAARDASLPIMAVEMREGVETFVVRDKDGTELFASPNPDAARIAHSRVLQVEFNGRQESVRQMIEHFQKDNEAKGRDPGAQTFDAEGKRQTMQASIDAGEVTIEQARERVQIAAASDPSIDPNAPFSEIWVLGSSQSGYVDGVWKDTIKLARNANPLTVVEERVEAETKRALAEGRLTMEFLQEQLESYEWATGEAVGYETPQQVIEGVSKLGVAYAAGKVKDEQLPRGLRGFLRSMLEYFKDILRRAARLKKAFRDGKLDAEFEAFLADAVGLAPAQVAAMETNKVLGEILGADATFSIEMNQDSPLGRARPLADAPRLDASNGTVIGPTTFAIGAYHGTPHKIDPKEGFRLDMAGQGEGAQAYGHGLYFSEARGVAKGYRERLAGAQWVDKNGRPLHHSDIGEKVSSVARKKGYNVVEADKIRNNWSDYARGNQVDGFKGIEILQEVIDGEGIRLKESGNLYTVELDVEPDQLLDWDRPLSEQSEKVKESLRKVLEGKSNSAGTALTDFVDVLDTISGNQLLREWKTSGIDDKSISEALLAAGIPGIRYLDQGSRMLGGTKYNARWEGNDPINGQRAEVYDVATGKVVKLFDTFKEADAWMEANKGEPTYNYVIFDESLIKITAENGQPVSMQDAATSFSIEGKVSPTNPAVSEINGIPAKDIFASAKEKFGTTRSIYEGGYLLPDGTMLDFTGRSQVGGDYIKGKDGVFRAKTGVRDWMRDKRGMDHREIEWEGMPEYPERWGSMVDFLRLGTIRIDGNLGTISMHSRVLPTSAQQRVLKDLVTSAEGAYLDLEDDAGNRAAMSLNGAKWGKVLRLLTQWSNGGNPEYTGTTFAISPKEAQDADYLAAVERGDMATAQRMVDEASRQMIKSLMPMRISDKDLDQILQDIDYFGRLVVNGSESGKEELFYSAYRLKKKGVEFFDAFHVTSESNFESIQQRGIDPIALSEIGDSSGPLRPESVYVFLDQFDALSSLKKFFGAGEHKIIRVKVPILELPNVFWDSNFNVSFGFATGAGISRRIPTSWFDGIAKVSADPVTYDDQGNVIPLSQRFNPGRPEITFAISPKEAFEQHPIIQAIEREGLLSKSQAARRWGKERFEKNKSLWDDAPALAHPSHHAIYKPNGLQPDRMASVLADEGLLKPDATEADLWEQIGIISKSAASIARQERAQEAQERGMVLESKARNAQLEAAMGRLDQDPDFRRDRVEMARNRLLRIKEAFERRRLKEDADINQLDIIRAFGELEAILNILPKSARGNVSFQLGKLAEYKTERGRTNQIVRKAEQVGAALENWLKAEYDAKLRTLLFERSLPAKDEPGQKPAGKAGGEIHALFARLREAYNWDASKAEASIASLESQIAGGELTAEKEAELSLESALLTLITPWQLKGAQERKAAYEAALHIWNQGFAAWKNKKIEEAVARERVRRGMIAATGKSGKRSERDLQALPEKLVRKGVRDVVQGLINFEQAMGYVFGHDSPIALRLSDAQRKAENAKQDEFFRKTKAVEDLFTGLAGGKALAGRKLLWNMAQKSIKVDGWDIQLSQLEAISVLLTWRQEDGKRHMLGKVDDFGNPIGTWHYNQTFVDRVAKQVSPEGFAVMDFLIEQYGSEYAGINEVFRMLNGIDLPTHENYSPVAVAPAVSRPGMEIDPVSGASFSSGSATPGSLKTRSSSAVAEPRFPDAIQQFIAHTQQMEHYKAFAPLARELRQTLAHRDVANAVEAKLGRQGRDVIVKWVDFLEMNGVRNSASYLTINKLLSFMTGNAISVLLVGRIGTLAIQATQIGAASAEMPLGAYIAGLGKLFTGQLEWKEAWKSPYIQRRIDEQPPVVRQMIDGIRASKPNLLKFGSERMGRMIGEVDAFWTAATYTLIYDYQLTQAKAQGLSGSAAIEQARNITERKVDRVAQPTRAGARSSFENNENGPLMKVAWAFASEARKNLGLLSYAMANRSAEDKLKAILYVVIINSVMASILRAAWRDLRDDDDDELFDEKHWDVNRLGLIALTEFMYGFPVIGEVGQNSILKLFGHHTFDGGMFSTISDAMPAVKRIPDALSGELETREVLRDVDAIMTAAGFLNRNVAASATFMHLVRDLYDVQDNVLQEE